MDMSYGRIPLTEAKGGASCSLGDLVSLVHDRPWTRVWAPCMPILLVRGTALAFVFSPHIEG